MEINKTYDIEELINVIKNWKKESDESQEYCVSIPHEIVGAILDVLKETSRREQRHKTLESVSLFVEKSEKEQTNIEECETNE